MGACRRGLPTGVDCHGRTDLTIVPHAHTHRRHGLAPPPVLTGLIRADPDVVVRSEKAKTVSLRAGALLAGGALICLHHILVIAGCAGEQAGERFARRSHNLPGSVPEEWRPESAVPTKPQKRPFNVVWEVTRHPDAEPTSAQQRAADDLVERCHAAAQQNNWYRYENGLRDGYRLQDNDEYHYYNWEYITDDALLDPQRPEYLMYYESAEGRRELLGFMFLVRERLEDGPQIGGPLTVWHYHTFSRRLCHRGGLLPTGVPLSRPGDRCGEGAEPMQRSPALPLPSTAPPPPPPGHDEPRDGRGARGRHDGRARRDAGPPSGGDTVRRRSLLP